jgi:hypothetical protein
LEATGQYLSLLYDAGNSGSTKTIDWGLGNVQAVAITAACAFTFTGGVAGGRYMLILRQGTPAYAYTSWSVSGGSVDWPSATAPTNSGAGMTDICSFIFDGTDFKGMYTLNFL